MDLKKLDKVATLARSEENRAAGTMQRHQQALARSTGRLEQLSAFKVEYQQRLDALSRDGIDARRLADYRQFLRRLDEAIQMLSGEISQQRGEVESSRESYVDRSVRRSAVDELISRGRAALLQAEQRAEQRASDEVNLQRHDDR